jgi:hypothetical protein
MILSLGTKKTEMVGGGRKEEAGGARVGRSMGSEEMMRLSSSFQRVENNTHSFRGHEKFPFSCLVNMDQKLYFC